MVGDDSSMVTSGDEDVLRMLRDLTRAHPLASFFLLAYGISWACWLPIAFSGGIVRSGNALPTHFPGLLGPMIAAIIVTAITEGRAGLRDLLARMGRWRVGLRWWLFAAGSPLAFYGVALAAVTVADGWPGMGGLDRVGGLPAALGVLGIWAALVFINGFGEETGWRGYALPQLQRRHGPLLATLILTLFWAAWHAPLFIILESFRGFSAATIPGFFLGMLCGAVILTWLYNGSGGSVLLAALWHGTYNLVSATDAAQGTIAAVVTALVMLWAVALVVVELRARRRPTPTPGYRPLTPA